MALLRHQPNLSLSWQKTTFNFDSLQSGARAERGKPDDVMKRRSGPEINRLDAHKSRRLQRSAGQGTGTGAAWLAEVDNSNADKKMEPEFVFCGRQPQPGNNMISFLIMMVHRKLERKAAFERSRPVS